MYQKKGICNECYLIVFGMGLVGQKKTLYIPRTISAISQSYPITKHRIHSYCICNLAPMDDHDFDSSGLVGHTVAASKTATGRTGGERRRAKNQLPRPFYLMRAGVGSITAAIVVDGAETTDGETVTWQVSSLVILATPVAVATCEFQYKSLFWKLRPASDVRVRSSTTTVGSTVNHHYPNFAVKEWLVWVLPGHDYEKLVGHDFMAPCFFESQQSYATGMGVLPAVVDRIPDSLGDEENAAALVFGLDETVEEVALGITN